MLFAVRGAPGVQLYNFQDGTAEQVLFKQRDKEDKTYCRVMRFSPDGRYFAFCDGHSLSVLDCRSLDTLWSADLPRTTDIEFSGNSTYLSAYEPFAVRKDEPEPVPNMKIFNAADGSTAMQYTEKRADWKPRWTNDEKIMSRSFGSEIHFYEPPNFERYVKRLVVKGFATYAATEGSDPHNVAVYVPGIKNSPCFVRIFRYPSFQGPESAISHASFFLADRASLKFSKRGDACLALTASDVDKSGGSYYGEQTLYLLLTNTESFRMQLAKEGPIYCCEFSPNNREFCAVYGYMPAKATVYNLRGDPVFDFGTGPRNEIHYNRFGDLLVLAGFGNLRGNVEFWSTKDWKLAQKVTAEDTTVFSWAPDGQHLLTATTAPRLRVGNGVRVWHYAGRVIFREEQEGSVEIVDACWCPAPEGVFEPKPIRYIPQAQQNVVISTGTETAKVPALAAYVPPHLRSQGRSAGPLRTLEPAQNAHKQDELSKAALKNKKKREAKNKKAKAGGDQPQPRPVEAAPSVQPYQPQAPQRMGSSGPGMDDKEKRIRNLTKKLESIEMLKRNQKEGKELELNQVAKLKTEQELRTELNALLH